jgi:hypothetical protein
MTTITAYYNVKDGMCYGYVDSALSSALGVPAGWYDVGTLLSATGEAYGGVVTSIEDASTDDTIYLVLEYVIYSYKDGWTALKFIGKNGTGASAEVFNHSANIASGAYSHAEGCKTEASGDSSHAEGYQTIASGVSSHAEGNETAASGDYSHAEGGSTTASGVSSHAEGNETAASGVSSHAEGFDTIASGDMSHAEGSETEASGNLSHAEGGNTTASGYMSHAEGCRTTASGKASHAEGSETIASGENSHAEGYQTEASRKSQHVQGEYNIVDTETTDSYARGKYAHIVGHGTGAGNRSNAHTLDWDGNAWYAGDVCSSVPFGDATRVHI